MRLGQYFDTSCAQDGVERGTLTKFIVVILDQSAQAIEKYALDIKVGACVSCSRKPARRQQACRQYQGC